jgi:D-3-phosphoglycerate dehydrogenase / 2-oxoglutarate reductase
MKILAVGDTFVPAHVFEAGLAGLTGSNQIRYMELDMDAPFEPVTSSDRAIREYAGNPRQLADALDAEEVLLVHGAPVTDVVLDASPNLRMVGVARGGPVNVDIAAATDRGIAVLTAPGRNADAVADLTLAFMIMLARGIMSSAAFVANGGRLGESTFEGAQFFGHELGGHTLGLVGYGNVGARVAQRALPFGMSIVVFDPYVEPSDAEAQGIEMVGLDELLARSDFVSLHARATPETVDFFNANRFGAMKPGSFFINSARETLVDEQALYDALVSEKIAGAALDVIRPRPDGSASPLVGLPNVVVTPHIGGATHEAALRGVQILADQIEQYAAGKPMEFVVNKVAAGSPR